MHVPDGFLSAGVAAGAWALGAGALGGALGAERRDSEPVPAGVLGALAAFVFAAQMVNIPVAPGTSGHLVGATLTAALVGPWRAIVVMAVVLAVQALLFQDGGITAYGVNLLAMGAVAVVVGFAVTQAIARRVGGVRGQAAGAVVGAFLATLAGATLIAAALAASGLYPARGILPVMLLTHVPIGLLEAALTGAILATVLRWRPDLAAGLQCDGRPVSRPVATALGGLGVALLMAAFAVPFASALPDGLEATAARLGFAAQARALWPAPAPGYELPWAVALGRLAPALAGLGGTILAAGLAWALSRGLSARGRTGHR